MNNIYTSKIINGFERYIPNDCEIYTIIDKNLTPYYHHFENYNIIEIETSEQAKVFDTVAGIVTSLLEAGADRDAFILGVGGGITTDIAGFVASIYKRGVRFGFIPTTLLSQVDAAIGGKNGVNFNSYKNIIGVINQPEFVYVCSEVLSTLTPREFKAGISEVLKSFILYDAEAYERAVRYFTMLEENLSTNGSYTLNGEFPQQEELTEIIGLCAKYKSAVVERDEFEKGERRLLNLGHTFAHAIEKICSKSGIMHGEAVSIGMVLAAQLAENINLSKSDFALRLKSDLAKVGLPVELPQEISPEQMFSAMTKDKKVKGHTLHLILPFGLEDVEDRQMEFNELEGLLYDMR